MLLLRLTDMRAYCLGDNTMCLRQKGLLLLPASRKLRCANFSANLIKSQTLDFLQFFLFFCLTRGFWRFPGQGSNLHHSRDLSYCSNNAEFLTHCTTVQVPHLIFMLWFPGKISRVLIPSNLLFLNKWCMCFCVCICVYIFNN